MACHTDNRVKFGLGVAFTWLTHLVHTYEDFSWTAADDLARMAGDDTLWRHYEQTAVQFEAPGSSGRLVPIADLDGGGEHPPLGSLHVVTAVQPDSDPASVESLARIALLDRELVAAGIRSIRAIGASLDGEHAEESRAVFGFTDEQARKLGLRFGQVAVFGWCGPRWSLLACATDQQTHRGWKWIAAGGQ